MYRGVSWIFFPTTLLAQGDSCIGSKTSINFGSHKNQLGGFYPPNKIFINLDFLDSLDRSQLKSGLGEMLHYFIVSSREDFVRFEADYRAALEDKKILSKLILRSLEIKRKYIEVDEFDQNVRQVFNYGHSFGHAIESLTQYRVPHGIAVSRGMDMANYISMKLGYIDENTRNSIRKVTEQIWKGTSLENIDVNEFVSALSKDKKNVGDKLGLILNKGYGKTFKEVRSVDVDFKSWIEEYFCEEL